MANSCSSQNNFKPSQGSWFEEYPGQQEAHREREPLPVEAAPILHMSGEPVPFTSSMTDHKDAGAETVPRVKN